MKSKTLILALLGLVFVVALSVFGNIFRSNFSGPSNSMLIETDEMKMPFPARVQAVTLVVTPTQQTLMNYSDAAISEISTGGPFLWALLAATAIISSVAWLTWKVMDLIRDAILLGIWALVILVGSLFQTMSKFVFDLTKLGMELLRIFRTR